MSQPQNLYTRTRMQPTTTTPSSSSSSSFGSTAQSHPSNFVNPSSQSRQHSSPSSTSSHHLLQQQQQQQPAWLQTARKKKKPPSFIQSQQANFNQSSFVYDSTFDAPLKKPPPPRVPLLNGGNSNANSNSMRKPKKGKMTSRYDSSLGLLTKKFLSLLRDAKDNVLDLNFAAEVLGVQKRRIYDITNVLEGVGLIEKKAKNHIRWRGSGLGPSVQTQKEMHQLRIELEDLHREELLLDEYVAKMKKLLQQVLTDPENEGKSYVTYDDIRTLPIFDGETLIAVRAPPGTTLSVPDPQEGLEYPQKRYQIFVKSHNGPIDVYSLNPHSQPSCSSSLSHSSGGSGDNRSISSSPTAWHTAVPSVSARSVSAGSASADSTWQSSPQSPALPAITSVRQSPSSAGNYLDVELPSPIRQIVPQLYTPKIEMEELEPRHMHVHPIHMDSLFRLAPAIVNEENDYFFNLGDNQGLSDIYEDEINSQQNICADDIFN